MSLVLIVKPSVYYTLALFCYTPWHGRTIVTQQASPNDKKKPSGVSTYSTSRRRSSPRPAARCYCYSLGTWTPNAGRYGINARQLADSRGSAETRMEIRWRHREPHRATSAPEGADDLKTQQKKNQLIDRHTTRLTIINSFITN